MHSPLPDSSVLEAGIIADPILPRTTDIQDRVRSLLRTSLYENAWPRDDGDDETIYVSFDNRNTLVLQSPLQPTRPSGLFIHATIPEEPESLPLQTPSPVLPSPHSADFNNMLIFEDPITSRSSLLPALDHPDLDLEAQHPDETHALLAARQKPRSRQHNSNSEWKHHRHHHRRHNHEAKKPTLLNLRIRALLCIGSGLLLAALLATYLSLVLSQSRSTIPPWWHILFILSLMVVTILFAHSIVRLCLVCSHPASHKKRHLASSSSAGSRSRSRSRRTLHARYRDMPSLSDIPGLENAVDGEIEQEGEERQTAQRPHPPPPAYGRWRGSVRVDPDVLSYHHHHILLDVSSSIGAVEVVLPSPISTAHASSPGFAEADRVYGARVEEVAEEDEEEEPPGYTSPVRVRGGGGYAPVEIAELEGGSVMF